MPAGVVALEFRTSGNDAGLSYGGLLLSSLMPPGAPPMPRWFCHVAFAKLRRPR
jgi:hypothetical protein